MTKKMYTKASLWLFLAGLALNVTLVWLTDVLSIPLYLDSIGTVLAAALGGALPGIAAGFLSNCVTSLLAVSPDPMTLYYGFLSVLIAVAAAWLSRKGLLRKWYGWLLALAAFSLVGGGLGSLMTWTLYGFSFGQGISAPLAQTLHGVLQMGEFSAQFAADMTIDLADKAVTTAVLLAVVHLLPSALMEKLPLGHLYRRKKAVPLSQEEAEQLRQERRFRRLSVRSKVTLLIVASAAILSLTALVISISAYRSRQMEQYAGICRDTVALMLPRLDGDRVEDYLTLGEDAPGYRETEQALEEILVNSSMIKYMYVYSVRPDGVHVVFDVDTSELTGESPGTVMEFDESFPYLPQALAGEDIPAFVTDDTYGWLLTVYKPLRASDGRVTAYAAADIDMQSIRTNIFSFCISIASLLFGMVIIITAFSLWYCDRALLEPMAALVEQARDFRTEGGHDGQRVRDRVKVDTGDELEEIFATMCRTEDAIAAQVDQLKAKNLEISRMQRNIIFALASMVENRDSNTGGHIRRTAGYVRLLGRLLLRTGERDTLVTSQYVRNLGESAPLHDIGKVKISDAILNKPGRLTPEEFELIKTHTTEGAAILRSSLSDIEDGSWLSMAIDMAWCHHERWDGSGYPRGLAGEDIPLCARIMAVADVFDALVSTRSYKASLPFDAALDIIRRGAGTQFDPRLTELFLSARDEVGAIAAGTAPV